MTATQPRGGTTRASKPVQSRSADVELSARFEREVVPLHESLYRHAFRMSKNHADAEDLVQDTMMNAYAGFHSFQQNTNLNAWLFRILTNTYINGYRKKRRQPVQYSAEHVTDQQWAEAHTHSRPLGLRSAEDQALDILPDNEIKAAMEALPQQFREAVYYADVEGFRYNEIAAMMRTPNGTVMSRLHRGRRQLRRLLGDDAGHIRPEILSAGASYHA